jgi:HPt (histidine-containing phosphotransfer) domain-containing protein
MLTADKLREFGADVDLGLARCMNNEGFYLMLVGKAAEDQRLTLLAQQIAGGRMEAAFETAHALKGMYANLSLDPLTKPISEITELLRSKADADYTALLNEAQAQFERLCAL